MGVWNIQSRGRVCALTGRSFADREACYTVLLGQGDALERLDLCAEAWKLHGAEVLGRPNLISHWRGVYEAPPPTPPEPIAKDDAESLLRRLIERDDPQYAGACYILAVMLERKRLLKVKTQLRESGRRVFVYEHPRSGDLFTIVEPELQLDQLDALQRQVADLLAQGPDGAPAAGGETGSETGPVEEPFNPPSDVASLAPAVD
ncbi:MAG: hypothetical protein KIT22_03160 [Verrucomicrobiae bacterium]|nr:hypothetical protein [Verrucomicrobiae bacterium]